MRLGIFAKTFPGSDPQTVFKAVKAAGYESVQYNFSCSGLDALPREIPDRALQAIRDASTAHGIAIAAISATYNMIHPDQAVRLAGRSAFAAIAAVARVLGVKLVTVCSGSCDPFDQWRFHPDNRMAESWSTMLDEMALLVRIADAHDINIGVEPEYSNTVYSAERARDLIDHFRGSRLRIVFDAANLVEHLPVNQHSAIIAGAVERLGPYIALAHAKDRDADGKVVAAGRGVIDFRRCLTLLREAGFHGDVVTHGLTAAEAPETRAYLASLQVL
jgi:sugar phosphate isomerase/epimerase